MSRFFLILITSAVLLLSPSVYAEGTAEQKSEISGLYDAFQLQLKAQNNEAAFKLAEQIYFLTAEVHSEISKSHATAVFNLAHVSGLMKKPLKSLRLFQEHMDILDQLKVPQDEGYVYKMNFLSDSYLALYDFENAAFNAKKTLRLAKGLSMNDRDIAVFELLLGTVYFFMDGKSKQSKRHINNSFDLFSTALGEHNVNTALAMFWQGKNYARDKKYAQAAEKYEKVLKIYSNGLPPGDGKILQIHAFLVNVYEIMGEKDKSTKHCIALATERPTDFDREIKPLYYTSLVYPMSARRSGKEGYIIAEFTVDEVGQVVDIKTIEGQNIGVFEKNAHKALSKYRYAPSIKNGKRVKTEGVLLRMTFELRR